MKTDRQVRSVATEFDIRANEGGGDTLVGHAAVFNSPTVIYGMWREQIAPRAFKKSIKESDIRALFNHDSNYVLGRNKAKTLRLSEDETGLAYEIDLPNTQFARDLWTSIDRGDISQSSFAFSVVKQLREEPEEDEGEVMPMITIKEARLYDVSPVTYPAYEDTDVSARVFMRCADLSGRTIEEVQAAYEAGDVARIWTPRGAADAIGREPLTIEDPAEPDPRSAEDVDPTDQPHEPSEDTTPEPHCDEAAALRRRDLALREVELIELT